MWPRTERTNALHFFVNTWINVLYFWERSNYSHLFIFPLHKCSFGWNEPGFFPSSTSPRSQTCGMGCAVSPKACLPSSEINLCPMQQECRWWRGFWGNVFKSRVATGQKRTACLFFYTLSVPLGHQHFAVATHNLAFWRRFGGSLLDRISRRSKWLKIWSVLACSSFSNTLNSGEGKENGRQKTFLLVYNHSKENNESHFPREFSSK